MPSNEVSAVERPKDRVPGLTKLFVWSIVLEPLLFFQIFPQSAVGVTGNASRLAQAAVIVAMLARFALATGSGAGRIRFVRLTNPLYSNYTTYYALAIVAGVIGAATGAYAIGGQSGGAAPATAAFINSATIRPLFEYVIAAYYFVYFTILPQYFLKTDSSIEYYFRVFRRMFYLCLIVGMLDLGLVAIGINLVPRALYDGTYIGFRFHGIAGEPRDAFVYMFFSLAVLHLDAFYHGEQLRKRWIIIAVTAALLTQSGSGLLGLLIFAGLYVVYTLPRMGAKRLAQLAVATLAVGVVVFEAVIRSERLMAYWRASSGIWSALESGAALPALISLQFTSFFPLYELFLKIRQGDWLPVLIGSGLGSASAVNTHYVLASAELSNPSSQFVRTMYESGFIGSILFLRAFTRPVTYLTRGLTPRRRHEFLVLMLALIGCFLAERSSAAFIYVGIVIAVFRLRGKREAIVVPDDSYAIEPAR